MPKRQIIGVVTSDKTAKTRRVEIARLVRHPKYGKFLRRTHGLPRARREQRVARSATRSRSSSRRPRSKTKRWDLVRVVAKSQQVDIAAMRAAAKLQETAATEGIV